MAKQNQNKAAETATETQAVDATTNATVAQTTEAVQTETKKGRKPSLATALKNMGMLRLPIYRGASAPKEPKAQVHLTGPTVDVAIISYANWRSSEGTAEKQGKWGIDEIVNGTDKKAPRIAKWRQDITAIVVDGVGQKYGGFISADPKHVDEVVKRLREWQAANEAKPTFEELCNTLETEQAVIDVVLNDGVRVAQQFTMLENFVEVQPKPRKERAKKEVAAPEATAEVAA